MTRKSTAVIGRRKSVTGVGRQPWGETRRLPVAASEQGSFKTHRFSGLCLTSRVGRVGVAGLV